MDIYEDIFTRGGGMGVQYEGGISPEFGPSVKDYERGGAGGTFKSPEELRRLQQDPKEWSHYLLREGIYQDYPFDDLDLDTTTIYRHLQSFPHLERRNIHLLVAAYLYRQTYPKGKVTSDKFLEFHKQFKGILRRVDLLRYIMIYDQVQHEKMKNRD